MQRRLPRAERKLSNRLEHYCCDPNATSDPNFSSMSTLSISSGACAEAYHSFRAAALRRPRWAQGLSDKVARALGLSIPPEPLIAVDIAIEPNFLQYESGIYSGRGGARERLRLFSCAHIPRWNGTSETAAAISSPRSRFWGTGGSPTTG
jgi:hypothetical protein